MVLVVYKKNIGFILFVVSKDYFYAEAALGEWWVHVESHFLAFCFAAEQTINFCKV